MLATGTDGTEHLATRLVVDSNDVAMVSQLLGDHVSRDDEIPALSLTRLIIHDLDAIVAGLPETTGRPTAIGAGDALETLMAWLRSESRREFGRVPEMGKDRVVLAGEGRPIPSPTTPQAAFGPFADPARAPRNVRTEDAVVGAGDATGTTGAADADDEDVEPVVVGVLDSSVVVKDQDFAGVVEFVGEDSELAPDQLKKALQGHGTFVTGLVNARAPRAHILVRAILRGDGFATAWDAAKGMADLASKHAHVINMSIGTVTGDQQPPFALQRAVERLHNQVVLVAAVGNIDAHAQGPMPPVWPAALPGVFAVGSVTREGTTSTFSAQEPWVQLAAVGDNVRSAFTTGDVTCTLDGGGTRVRHFWGTAIWSGTSFAAAVVSGRLARLAGRTAGDRVHVIRRLAEQLRTGELADDVIRQP